MKKTLTIPIYDCTVYLWVTKNFQSACQKSGYSEAALASNAAVFRYPDKPGVYSVIFHKDAISPGNIAHEALHLLHDIMEYVDMGANTNDDEAQAYLIGFIVDLIHQAIEGQTQKGGTPT